jgi:oleandomycin transport system ATP-binding protein
VIYLDEPTTGLDPGKREDVWHLVRRLVGDGTTVLLTTQYLEEADALADEISVIDHGKVIAHGTPAELKHIVGGQTLEVRPTDPANLGAVEQLLTRIANRPTESPGRGVLSVPVESDVALTTVVRLLDEAGIGVTELSLRLPSLDEAFFTLTGRPAAEESTPENAKDIKTTAESAA